MGLEKVDKALEVFSNAYTLSLKQNDPRKKALILSNLGYVRALQGETEGVSQMLEAIQIRNEINDFHIFKTFQNITDYYLIKENKLEGLKYGKEAYTYAKQTGNLNYLDIALSNLIKLGEVQYATEYNTVIEKIRTRKDILRNTFAEARYNLDKEKDKTRKEREKRYQERVLYISVGIVAIELAFVFLFFYVLTKHKRQTLTKQFETEQEISKKLHDEVANDVFYVMTKVQSGVVQQEELVDNLDEIYHKARDISKVYSDIDVSTDFNALINDLINSFKAQGVNIFTKNSSQISWSSISELKKKVLYRVLQELMTNMRKHSSASLVTLSFEREKNKLKIAYVDNGVGCEISKGTGLSSTENRMELVGGTITFESGINKGFKANLTL